MSRALLLHGEIPEPASRPKMALAAKGFRPFFLLAAAFAIAIVPIWLLVVRGVLRPTVYLDPTSWHAHEMIFGFLTAVIAGFLLTAVGNWTQRETLVGPPLLALSALWLLGRVAMAFAGALPHGVPAIVDLAFLPTLMVILMRPLLATKNYRHLLMVALLGGLFVANLVMHLDGVGLLTGVARHASLVALDVVLLMILMMAGRVFPMFARNATGVKTIRSIPALDIVTVLAMVVLIAVDVFVPDTRLASVASGVVGVVAAIRAVHWGMRHSFREPLLWILHAGYAWLTLGLLLRALAGFDSAVSASLATHALTVGAAGSITLGMMARVALGHTGRPLVVRLPIVWAFAAVSAAAVTRVIVPLFAPEVYLSALVVAGVLWTLAFLLFLVVYVPILVGARVDGKAG